LPTGTLSTAVEAAETLFSVPNPRVAVEAFVPRGGFAEYGLLGMQFEPTTERALRVDVPYTGTEGILWAESLVGRIDAARVGLLDLFAQTILDTVATQAKRRFPPGTIRVVEAVQGAIGSNQMFFKSLAICVLDLMLDEHHRSDEELAPFLRERLVTQYASLMR
jgi:hypothetical protein